MEKITRKAVDFYEKQETTNRLKFEINTLIKEQKSLELKKFLIVKAGGQEHYSQSDLLNKIQRELESIKFKKYILIDLLKSEIPAEKELEKEFFDSLEQLDKMEDEELQAKKRERINRELKAKGIKMQLDFLETL